MPTETAARYIVPDVIERLRVAKSTSSCSLGKLIRLLEELDDCYVHGHAYACHALLRAVTDHVPPVFGQPNFAGLVNNVSWGKTDKAYMKRLDDFRKQADDVLHRPIGKSPDVLGIDDLPARAALNVLLNALIGQL